MKLTVTGTVCVLSHFSYVRSLHPLDCSRQALPSMAFSKQQYRSGLLCPSPEDLSDPGTEPTSHVSCIGWWVLYHLGNPTGTDKYLNRKLFVTLSLMYYKMNKKVLRFVHINHNFKLVWLRIFSHLKFIKMFI